MVNVQEKIFVNLNIDKHFKNAQIVIDKRELDKEFEYKYEERNRTLLNIPGGFELKDLPNNASYSGKEFGFFISYSVEGNKIYLDKEIYINTLVLKSKNFKDWNKMIDRLTMAYGGTIVLVKSVD